MKHLEVRQKHSAARRIFNFLLSVSSGDETLLDILRNYQGNTIEWRRVMSVYHVRKNVCIIKRGRLSNDDRDSNENGGKRTTLHVHEAFFVHAA